jgi:O-antigen/teichoic acid export membrane protein
MWIGQRRVCEWLRHGFTHASFFEIKRLTPPAFSSLAFPLGNALNVQGIRLIIGMTIGPSAVALFVPMRTLSRIVMQPGAIIGRLIQPELALAYGAGDNSNFQLIFIRSSQLALSGCFGVCLLVGPGAYWIFPTWTGGMLLIHWPTYFILLAVVMTNSIWIAPLIVQYAINCHERIAPYYIFFYGIITIGLGYIGSTTLGIIGTAIALLSVEIIMAFVVIHASLGILKISFFQWIKTILNQPFLGLKRITKIFSTNSLVLKQKA